MVLLLFGKATGTGLHLSGFARIVFLFRLFVQIWF